jgi:hypothetical protein
MARPRPRIIISFELPSEIRSGFPLLLDKVKKHIVRESIRSAILPVRNALKAKVMTLPQQSDQSTGATARAIDSKYKNSISDPFRFYGIVGVNRKHIEAVVPEASPVYRNSLQRQVAFGIKRRSRTGRVTSTRNKRREVRSTHKKYIGKLRKRWPNKYLHLWEYGFANKRGARFAGHHFFSAVKAATESQARAIFTEKVLYHFKKAMS